MTGDDRVVLELEFSLDEYLALVTEARMHGVTEDEFVHRLVTERRRELTS